MSSERTDNRSGGGESSPEFDALHWGTLRDWAELVRLPNIFTVISNSIAAALIVCRGWPPILSFLLVLIASILAYWAGMILNDVVDLEEDRKHRSNRPLARGSVSPAIAAQVGTFMLLLIPMLVLFAVYIHPFQPLWLGAAFMSAVGLAVCVRLYDSSWKPTPIGPVLMGGCRALNVLMVGCSMFAVLELEEFPRGILIQALGLGLYVLGITVFARREETDSGSTPAGLIGGIILETMGIVLFALLPWWSDPLGTWYMDITSHYPILITLIGLTVLNRDIMAVMHPVSRKVQLAVKHSILTMVLLDASIVAVCAGPWAGGFVALLLAPTLLLAARFRST